ncbi:MAG: hypothetical protein ACLR3C_03625 [Eggerthella lenta]
MAELQAAVPKPMRGENPDFWQFSTGFCRLFLNSLLYAETELLPGCIGSG